MGKRSSQPHICDMSELTTIVVDTYYYNRLLLQLSLERERDPFTL